MGVIVKIEVGARPLLHISILHAGWYVDGILQFPELSVAPVYMWIIVQGQHQDMRIGTV